ncbi:hypothetical protein QUF55_10450, partial [Clostridiaceae bacterium HSG29]|nr:hypothetical protein [Clostridiaceae bacterium HSG29]
MYLIYLNYAFIIGIIYVMYLIKKRNRPVNKKYILILLVIVLIVNSMTIIGFINKKNQLTESTYMIYSSFCDSLRKTTYSNEVETIEDVKKLLEVTEDIYKNLSMLEYNLRFSEVELNYEDDQEIYLIIKNLNDYLSEFIFEHNRLYSKRIYIDENIQEKYSKLKIELNILYDYFSLLQHKKTEKLGGITEYYILPKE